MRTRDSAARRRFVTDIASGAISLPQPAECPGDVWGGLLRPLLSHKGKERPQLPAVHALLLGWKSQLARTVLAQLASPDAGASAHDTTDIADAAAAAAGDSEAVVDAVEGPYLGQQTACVG